jgi:hypothetical protein
MEKAAQHVLSTRSAVPQAWASRSERRQWNLFAHCLQPLLFAVSAIAYSS